MKTKVIFLAIIVEKYCNIIIANNILNNFLNCTDFISLFTHELVFARISDRWKPYTSSYALCWKYSILKGSDWTNRLHHIPQTLLSFLEKAVAIPTSSGLVTPGDIHHNVSLPFSLLKCIHSSTALNLLDSIEFEPPISFSGFFILFICNQLSEPKYYSLIDERSSSTFLFVKKWWHITIYK